MPIANGSGGYQIGTGNASEPITAPIDVPISIAASATLTPAQVLNGLILVNNGVTAAAQTYTLPTVAELELLLTNSDRTGTAFVFRVVNLGTSSGTAIIAAGTGWNISGSLTMTIPVTTGAMFIARKSAVGAWTLYRVT
jgi:hypothetical protein